LGHGLITDNPAIFDDILMPTSIEELQYKGFLAKLRSKVTGKKLSVDGVHKRGGEYIDRELQAVVDTADNNEQVIREVLGLAGERKHWLVFCTGVDHAYHVRDLLKSRGITAETVTGKTPKKERDRIIGHFRAGEIQALTNANVLTTGFDYPDIDLIVMMRPTMSPGLYIQMAGRGLRLKSDGGDCLVLDFAGVVEKHGPITDVATPQKPGEGLAPSKVCPECDEIIHASLMTCHSCGYEFPPNEAKPLILHEDDIQGDGTKTMDISRWSWQVHTSQKSGKNMLKVTYDGALNAPPIIEYLCVMHDGYTGYKALERLKAIASRLGADINQESLEMLCSEMGRHEPPTELVYKKNGKFFDVIDRIWGEKEELPEDDDFIFF